MGLKLVPISSLDVWVDEDTGRIAVCSQADILDVDVAAIVAPLTAILAKLSADPAMQTTQVDVLKALKPSYLGGATKTGTSGVKTQVSAISMPCHYVLVQPLRSTAGVLTNTHIIFLGNTTDQWVELLPSSEGIIIPIANLNLLFMTTNHTGDGVKVSAYGEV